MTGEKQTKRIRPGTKSILVSFALALIVGALVVYFAFPQKENTDNPDIVVAAAPTPTSAVIAKLTGFEPGAEVKYKILGSAAEPVQSTLQISESGELYVPMPEGLATADAELIYEFSVKESHRNVSLLLRHDVASGSMSLEGKSSQPFTAVQIGAGGKQINTKTDWAGLFAETGIPVEKHNDNEDPTPVQVAFYNNDIATDGREYQSNAVIQVLVAPGGGGPTSAGLNVWFEPFCGTYPLSTCDTGTVDNQNQSIIDNFVYPMMQMAEQLSVVAAQQVAAIGMFLDAKQQLENQRTHQQLKAEAVKDYHPSEQMCRIGSYVRSLAIIEEKMIHDQFALNDIMLEQEVNRLNVGTGLGRESDFVGRLENFKATYCDPNDNNAGLEILCDHSAGVGAILPSRMNKDIDYQRTLESPYTLDIDFTDAALTDDEADVIALGRNLYWPEAFDFFTENDLNENSKYYMRARSLRALNNLAHNSFSNLVAMKARAPNAVAPVQPGWTYMKTMMRELMGGATAAEIDTNIEQTFGQNPSYYAQMDFLTKKIYQNPDFYTNLYDKPVNVDRIETALDAISMMQMRDHYEASLRREMLLSGIIENEMITNAEILQGKILSTK